MHNRNKLKMNGTWPGCIGHDGGPNGEPDGGDTPWDAGWNGDAGCPVGPGGAENSEPPGTECINGARTDAAIGGGPTNGGGPCGALTAGGKRGPPGKLLCTNAGGPLLNVPLWALGGGMLGLLTEGGKAAFGRAPSGGALSGGVTELLEKPEEGTVLEGGLKAGWPGPPTPGGGGLDTNGDGCPTGGPLGLIGAMFGGNADGGPDDVTLGRVIEAGGGPGRENWGGAPGIPAGWGAEEGKGGDWPNGGLGNELGIEGGRLRFILLKLSAKEPGFVWELG